MGEKALELGAESAATALEEKKRRAADAMAALKAAEKAYSEAATDKEKATADTAVKARGQDVDAAYAEVHAAKPVALTAYYADLAASGKLGQVWSDLADGEAVAKVRAALPDAAILCLGKDTDGDFTRGLGEGQILVADPTEIARYF